MVTLPTRYTLSDEEARAVRTMCNGLLNEGAFSTIEAAAANAVLHSDELPRPLRNAIHEFRVAETAPALLLRGLPLPALASTPNIIEPGQNARSPDASDVLLLLLSSRLGQVFTWTTIQHGNLVNQVVPILKNRSAPMSSGYESLFDLHTEDAYNRNAGEYLALLCLRNPTGTPTTIAYLPDATLTDLARSSLQKPNFLISANVAHAVDSSRSRTAVLFGHPDQPYIRFNFNGAVGRNHSGEPLDVLMELKAALSSVAQDVALEPGDLLLIDNLQTLHARPAYSPALDGVDRWLKRAYVSSSWRASRRLRGRANELVIDGSTNA